MTTESTAGRSRSKGLAVLAPFALSPDEVLDLSWYYGGGAAGALGERSNFGAMVAVLQMGPCSSSSPPSADVGVDRAAAVQRARRLEQALGRLAPVERLILSRAYDHADWPGVPTWGRAAPVVALASSAEKGHHTELTRAARAFDSSDPFGPLRVEARQKAALAHPHLASVEDWLFALAKRSRDGKCKTRPADLELVGAIKAEALSALESAEKSFAGARWAVGGGMWRGRG